MKFLCSDLPQVDLEMKNGLKQWHDSYLTMLTYALELYLKSIHIAFSSQEGEAGGGIS